MPFLILQRGNTQCKDLLISWGADTEILSKSGQTPLSLETTSQQVNNSNLINIETSNTESTPSTHMERENGLKTDTIGEESFVPSYLRYPALNPKVEVKEENFPGNPAKKRNVSGNVVYSEQNDSYYSIQSGNKINDANVEDRNQYKKATMKIIKARFMKDMIYDRHANGSLIMSIGDVKIDASNILQLHQDDFIEVDIPVENMTMNGILVAVLGELINSNERNFDMRDVYIRKLPNTRLRKDVEIARLNDYAEIEVGFLSSLKNEISPNPITEGNGDLYTENNEK